MRYSKNTHEAATVDPVVAFQPETAQTMSPSPRYHGRM
jgi:hypothetical protein